VVPGGIEAKRRDYGLVLDAFEAAWELDPAIELTLLGGPVDCYGKKIIERCRLLVDKGLQITFFTGFVAQGEFQIQMCRAHIVLAPIQLETSFSGGEEIYGRTKSSGTVGDLIRYSKSALVPQEMHVLAELEPSLMRYSDREHFIRAVRRLAENRSLREQYVRSAYAASEHFMPQAVYLKNRSLLEGLSA